MLPEPIIPDSYWVDDRLAAGEYPGASHEQQAMVKVARFEDAGVTLFVDLTHPTDNLEPYAHHAVSARRARHPIVDNDVPTVAQMAATLDTIDTAHTGDDVVYVHCWGGIGRTGLVVGCWLVRHGSSPQDAVTLIRERRSSTPDYQSQPESPQTRAQHAFLRAWRPGQ